jgi:hypothetical protein
LAFYKYTSAEQFRVVEGAWPFVIAADTMVCSTLSVTMPESDAEQELPLQYKGWALPSPPSVDSNDRCPPPVGSGLQYPEFGSWKRDLDMLFKAPKPPKNTTTYIEWKTSSKKRKKKKKAEGDETSCQSTIIASEDGAMYVRRARSSSSRSSSSAACKENTPSSFRPAFSHSRYSKQQQLRALTSYYKEKMKTESRQDDSLDQLVAIKMELSDLKEWAKKKRDKSKTKRVHFAHPLILSLNYRPKTLPEEIDALYFREDELLDWEEDRETTPFERFEVSITEDEGQVAISSDCRSCSSHDSHM